MNLKDCYIKFGGDFDEVLGRLRREQSVQKFMYKFLDDKSFQLFEASMENKDYEEALRAVHTLKGICQNLSFATVYKGNIIKNLIMDCQSYTKYRPNETTGGIFVSWRRKEELPTGA